MHLLFSGVGGAMRDGREREGHVLIIVHTDQSNHLMWNRKMKLRILEQQK